jgi:putative transposase
MEGYFHVWFSTKGRKEVLEGELDDEIKSSMRGAAARASVEVVELETAYDHVHVLLRLRRQQTVASAMHRLKGASARHAFAWEPELAIDFPDRHLWQRSYGWRRVPPEQVEGVRRYIRTQRNRPNRDL